MAFEPEQTPSGRWRGGYRHPVTGKRIRKTFDHAHDAASWAATEEQNAKDSSGVHHSPTPDAARPPVDLPTTLGPSVADYGRQYLANRRGELTTATLNKYRAAHNGLAIPVGNLAPIAGMRMGEVDRDTVRRWVTASTVADIGRPTINLRLSFLRRMYRDAIDRHGNLMFGNPTAGVKLLTEDRNAIRFLLPHEQDELLADAPDAIRVPAMIGLHAGLRWSEVFGLPVDAVTGGGSFLDVRQVVERDQAIRRFTKNHLARQVPMPDDLAEALEPLTAGRGRGDLIFHTSAGTPMHYRNWTRRVWGPWLARIGHGREVTTPTGGTYPRGPNKGQPKVSVDYETDYGFHALRHTYGSTLAAAGVPTSEIMKLMGHADERTTLRYIHAGTDGKRLALVRDIFPGGRA